MKLERVLCPLNDLCWCGGQMVLAEYMVECCEIQTDEEGKQKIVRTGEKTETGMVCSRCVTQGSTGKPASCF